MEEGTVEEEEPVLQRECGQQLSTPSADSKCGVDVTIGPGADSSKAQKASSKQESQVPCTNRIHTRSACSPLRNDCMRLPMRVAGLAHKLPLSS